MKETQGKEDSLFFKWPFKIVKIIIIQAYMHMGGLGGGALGYAPPLSLLKNWFYLNRGTIDLLCIILLIKTVGAWDFLSQKTIRKTNPWLPWNCLKIITKKIRIFYLSEVIRCCLNALNPKNNTYFIKYIKNKLFLKKKIFY